MSLTHGRLLLGHTSGERGILELSKLKHEFSGLGAAPGYPASRSTFALSPDDDIPFCPRQVTPTVENRDQRGTRVTHIDRKSVLLLLSVERKQRVYAIGDARGLVEFEEDLRGHCVCQYV